MNHLTTSEIFQIVDETLANGARTRIVAHLEVCPRCRQEVDFQRKLLRGARSAPLVRPSAGFRHKVLSAVATPLKWNVLQTAVNSLGSVLAMGIVLTVVWYAATATSPPDEVKRPSMFSDAAKTYVDYYARAREFIVKSQAHIIGEPAKKPPPKNENIIVLTMFSVIILVAVDRFVVRKLMRVRQ